jgi:hypothetical protein
VPPGSLRMKSALSQAAIHYIPVRRPDRIACAPVLTTTFGKQHSEEQCRRLRTVAIAEGGHRTEDEFRHSVVGARSSLGKVAYFGQV